MFEDQYPKPGQQPLFGRDPVEAAIERVAAEALAEIQSAVRVAHEEIDRRLAFIRRSQSQRRRFERYRQLEKGVTA
jgi:glutathione S-transferase